MSTRLVGQAKPVQVASTATAPSSVLQRKCACGGTPGPTGECAACRRRRLPGGTLQTKLRISQPGDPFEREADRVAEQIMRMPERSLQRQLDKDEEEELPQTKSLVQRRVTGGEGGSEAPPIVQEVLWTPGKPLDSSVRATMESRFGHDFRQVRVHTDGRAVESARAVKALAYTVGSHVVFDEGQYAPGSSHGQRVIAHELAHVVQQGNQTHLAGSIAIGPDGDNFEQQAEENAQRLVTRPKETFLAPLGKDTGNSLRLHRLGANPGCSDAERDTIHQAIFNARGWLNKAMPQLEADPLSDRALRSLRRNFGPTYGVAANASLIAGRLQTAYRELSTIPFRCAGAGDATCGGGACGYAVAGSHDATICTNVTLVAGTDWRYQAGCALHEALHAAFSRFTVDEYSGWHGASGSTPTYPGAGTDPLLNADSYTTLAMDLS